MQKTDYPPVLVLLGPTASGKTALATELVQRYPLEIISVDSALVYHGMDIGTAKPTDAELQMAPHRLINLCDPADAYSVAQFCADAKAQIDTIYAAGKQPLLVGGSMMYFHALISGIAPLPERCKQTRQVLEKEAELKGLNVLFERLKKCDPDSAAWIKPTDPQRILRALEVFELTGKPLSFLQKQTEGALPYPIKAVGLMPEDRAWLHERIAQRCENMFEEGLIEEVRSLKNRGDLNLDMPSMRCVGYRQVWQYLDGQLTEREMKEALLAATRQLAKRQMTWMRKFDWVECVDPASKDLLPHLVSVFQL